MKKSVATLIAVGAIATTALLTGCAGESVTVSENLSTDADNFKIERNIIFYNGITNEVMAEMTGFCSITDEGNQLEVTCKEGDNRYTKDFLGLSDNVTYMALQTDAKDVSVYHRKFVIKPEALLPEFEFSAGKQ